MSFGMIDKRLEAFLESHDEKVLSINGKWGVGKTYSWNDFIYNVKGKITQNKYSYVSLFGLNSLSDIRRAVFENAIDKRNIDLNSSDSRTIDNYSESLKKFSKKNSRILSPMGDLFVRGLGSSIDKVYESYINSSVKDFLICFDDIERHSKSVSLRDFLGLVSELKERKNCTIVFLLNEDSHDLEDYNKYKEKVVDVQVLFKPEVIRSYGCVFNDDCNYYEAILHKCEAFNITNIRSLLKIRGIINRFFDVVNDSISLNDDSEQKIAEFIVFIFYCFQYGGEDRVPNLAYIKNHFKRGDDQVFIIESIPSLKDSKVEDVRKIWDDFIRMHNISYNFELECVLIDFVESGFLNPDTIIENVEKFNRSIIAQRNNVELSNLWDSINNTWSGDDEIIVNEMNSILSRSINSISTGSLAEGLIFLRHFGKDDWCESLIEKYIKSNHCEIVKCEYNPDESRYNTKDESFTKKLNEYVKLNCKKREVKTIGELLMIEMKNNFPDYKKMESLLGELDKEQTMAFIKTLTQDERSIENKIVICINACKDNQEVNQNFIQALRALNEKGSTLDSYRTERFSYYFK